MSVIKQHQDISALLSVTHIGVDEAGRGCLAGPVVAAAVLFPPSFDPEALLPGLNDSKQLSEKTRETLAPLIMRLSLSYGVGLAWPSEIDLCNIVSANYRAMARAILQLSIRAGMTEQRTGAEFPLLLIDGNLVIRRDQWLAAGACLPGDFFPDGLPGRVKVSASYPGARHPRFFASVPRQTAVIKGDSRVPAIAAASVLAKTRRDAIMRAMDRYYPGFGFAKHKGYATKEHFLALRTFSPCPLHRASFLKKMTAGEQQLTLL